MKIRSGLIVLLALCLFACAGPKPDLKASSRYQSVGDQIAERDITDCKNEALDRGIEYGQARGGRILKGGIGGLLVGAIVGAIGGVTSGTSGIAAIVGASVLGVGGIIFGAITPLEPSGEYQSQVDNCLREKGYEFKGWK